MRLLQRKQERHWARLALAEHEFKQALKRIEENGAGILKASNDNDESRIHPKIAAMTSSLDDAETALCRMLVLWREISASQ
jgi:hypothetical protein